MKRLIAWFAQNGVASNLLMLLLIIAGMVQLPGIPQKSFPDLEEDLITVGVTYLGAAPEEVELGVCTRVEEAIDGLEGIDQLRTSANEGACAITVKVFSGEDPDDVLDEIKTRVDGIETLPEETEQPVIARVAQKRPVADLALTGHADERTLKELAERLRDELAAKPEITQVEVSGVRDYEISIEVSEANLRRFGLSFDDVARAVRRSSLDLPGGTVKASDGDILLRTKGQAYRGLDFERLVLLTRPDGTRVRLADVATVIDGFSDVDQWLRFDGKPAAMIRVFRVGDQDLLEIAEVVREYLDEARERLPAGIDLVLWRDGSRLLRDRLDTLISSGRMGFLLVLLLLALFLRPRLSFWVSLGIPVSFLGALWMLPVLGLSIDGISLFGFILVLGILVDDAIVIGENIYRRQGAGETRLPAAIAGAQEVALPVVFGVLTTVVAFLPLLLGPGTMGQIMAIIATIVMLCLGFSLVESQLILPGHLGHGREQSASTEVAMMAIPVLALLYSMFVLHVAAFAVLFGGTLALLFVLKRLGLLERPAARLLELQTHFAQRLEAFTVGPFHRAMERALDWRYTTVALSLGALVCTAGVLGSGRLRFSFFPPVESDTVTAQLTLPPGTPAATTEVILNRIESAALELRRELDEEYRDLGVSLIKNRLTSLGVHALQGPPVGPDRRSAGGGHLGEVTLELIPSEQRDLSTRAVAQRWRELTGPVPEATELIFASSLFSVGEAINIQLQGRDVGALSEAADELKQRLADYSGVIDIADSFRPGKREVLLSITPEGEALGLTLNDLARQVRQAFYGEEAQRIQRGRDDVRVMVRYPSEQRRQIASLESMRIRTPDGSEVPFSTVARAELDRGYSTIRRADRQRVVNVTADVDRTLTTANFVIERLRETALPEIESRYPGVTYSFEGEQKEQAAALTSFVQVGVAALFVMYALLAIPLGSYTQPLLIMSAIPFAFVGAVIGHLIMGHGLSFMSLMGIIAAAGVVVNSSLVLVHYVNGEREAGSGIQPAARSASIARFRPILLTALTTFIGLVPLMLNRSVQAQFLVPMAISLAFGVACATVVTLFVVPSWYLILEEVRGFWEARKGPPQTERSRVSGIASV